MSANSPTPKQRLGWIDAGRGTAVLGVVLFHSANWLTDAGFRAQGWQDANAFLASLRLPLFFAMSGLLARKWTTVPWRTLWSGKLALFVWVYAVWSVIATFTFMLGLQINGATGGYRYEIFSLSKALWSPRFELWFIWGLTWYFVLARLTQKLPPWLVLALTGLTSAVVMSIPTVVNAGPGGAARYVFFFFVGLHGREAVLALAKVTNRAALLALMLVWALVAGASTFLEWGTEVPAFYFVTCCLGVAAGVTLARVLQRLSFLRWVGARTLPVYLTHTAVVLTVCWVLHFAGPEVKSLLWLAILLVPALAATAALFALGLSEWVKERTVLRYLYDVPPAFAHARRPSPSPRPAPRPHPDRERAPD